MTKLTKDIIGKEVSSFSYKITREKVLEFLNALQESNPVFSDQEYAKRLGYEDTPLPPTANTMILFWGNPDFYSDMESIGINKNRFLHYREEYTNLLPLYPDRIVHVKAVITDVKIGKMEMVSSKTTFYNEKKQECIAVDSTIIIRPEE